MIPIPVYIAYVAIHAAIHALLQIWLHQSKSVRDQQSQCCPKDGEICLRSVKSGKTMKDVHSDTGV
jgi:hypothetical protein